MLYSLKVLTAKIRINERNTKKTIFFLNSPVCVLHFYYLCHLNGLVTPSRQKKKRVSFVLHSTFRNFGRNLKLSLFIGGLRDNAIFEVTNWKPSYFRILPRYAYC